MKKPRKPYLDFPLTPHPCGQWCKRIRGRLFYFGVLADPDAALRKYLDWRDDLQAGRDPRNSLGTTVEVVVNDFLDRCHRRVVAGELSAVSFADYRVIGKLIADELGRGRDVAGLRPADFAKFRDALAARYSAARISKVVTMTRAILTWAFESETLESMPRFGPDFKVAGRKASRIRRAGQAKKLLTAREILSLLAAADAKWKAILLLCISGGLGNSDIARITLADVHHGQWLSLPRGKTGVGRRIPLWTETQQAVQAAIRDRIEPKAAAENLLFLSGHGGPLISVRETGKRTDLTTEGFRRLAVAAGVYRPRMGLYWLRHTFQTIGDGAKDPVATSAIMGHVDASMAGQYRESIDDDRLLTVTNHVRAWLFCR